MDNTQVLEYIKEVIQNTPKDWIKLTTHRLDIYNEELAKSEFIDEFEKLYKANKADNLSLSALPTAYDYIRLGHPLSSVLEWTISQLNGLSSEEVISFSSQSMPILAILRTNRLQGKATRIVYDDALPAGFDADTLKSIYGYSFEMVKTSEAAKLDSFSGSTIWISQQNDLSNLDLQNSPADFFLSLQKDLGSVIIIEGEENKDYIGAIQHVRRRESIAMTPANCYIALQKLAEQPTASATLRDKVESKKLVMDTIREVTAANTEAVLGSSGLSVQYGVMMGLVEDAFEKHPNKEIRFLVPPNCYGGTNDQARRVAACIDKVQILDLPVDGENDMVQSTERVLEQVAQEDAVPYLIVEIPTNPRVEVPHLENLVKALGKKRKTKDGNEAITPVFIIDQTFCPNIQFLSSQGIFAAIKTLSYVSGSKFPSGGKCTAGYVVANDAAAYLMPAIKKHMVLTDNEATDLQVEILAEQLPSMNQRIADAYTNTREFVNFIHEVLPTAKINFVPEELAERDFTPSVFSLDLPTKGDTPAEREEYKRAMNLKLIKMMITQIPEESKYCVSYGQLKGCYWTIPATSTQGTTKEEDKDYIARVSVSPDLDLEKHKEVFADFVKEL